MPLSDTTQQDWSALLQKEKMQRQQTLRVPIATKKKQIDDQILYYKGILQRNLLANIKTGNENIVKKLIELRASQTVYILLAKEEEQGYLDATETAKEVERYAQDCLKLVTHTETSL